MPVEEPRNFVSRGEESIVFESGQTIVPEQGPTSTRSVPERLDPLLGSGSALFFDAFPYLGPNKMFTGALNLITSRQ